MKKEILSQLIESNADILLLDIREAEELTDTPTIRGATHMPMGKVFTEAGKGNLPHTKQIVVFCKTGTRAEIVEQELRARDYIVDGLEGGLNNYVTTEDT